MAALKKEVGAGGEVKTVGYMVTQRLGEPKKGERNQPIVGYTVTNVVRVADPRREGGRARSSTSG